MLERDSTDLAVIAPYVAGMTEAGTAQFLLIR